MTGDITWKVENFLCQKLRAALPGFKFLPFNGGSPTADATELDTEPPNTVVMITDADKVSGNNLIYKCRGVIQTITHITEHTPVEHQEMAQSVVDAFLEIEPETTASLDFSGLDIGVRRNSDSPDGKMRAAITEFVCGVSG